MIRVPWILIFLFLPASILYGQQNYLLYHQDIAKAEQQIVNKEYTEALSSFETVFDSYEFVFLRDYKVASQLALLLNEKEKAFQYLEQGVLKGWSPKAARKNKLFTSISKDSEWKALEAKYDSIKGLPRKDVDYPLRLQVHQMFKKDQKKALGAWIRIGQKAKERYAEEKFAPHSEKQMLKLHEIIVNNGYPGEKLVGNNLWASTIISHHNSISTSYVRKDTLFAYLKPKLLEALKNGEISPYEYALMVDWKTAVESNRQETAFGFLGAIQEEKQIRQVNENRNEIGLRSITLRNALVDAEQETGINFYLPGEPWQEGTIGLPR